MKLEQNKCASEEKPTTSARAKLTLVLVLSLERY